MFVSSSVTGRDGSIVGLTCNGAQVDEAEILGSLTRDALLLLPL
jgi:hypothetical protein